MFFGTFLRNLACVGGFRRGVAGINRQPPELTPRGAFWGTAISRSDLNSPYPTGVLACQTQFGLPPVPEGFPLLTSPPGPARPSNPKTWGMLGSFFALFSFFSVLQKTMKKRMVKKSTFSANFDDYWASDVDV